MRRRIASVPSRELLRSDRAPELIDHPRGLAGDRGQRALEMLCPQSQPRPARETRVARDNVHLRIVELMFTLLERRIRDAGGSYGRLRPV